MKSYVVLNKKVGQTPLAAIEAWKAQNPAYAAVAASYAGRLDPMASGTLLILLGEECKRQHRYTNLDKEYEIEVLLGVGSDTGDVLGLPEYSPQYAHVNQRMLKSIVEREQGMHLRAYPAFSSKTVQGKPLFLYALLGTLADIKIPEHLERIFRISQSGSYSISGTVLAEKIKDLLAMVPRTTEPSKQLGADFRVDTIRAMWGNLLASVPDEHFTVLRLKVICASGTYMRSLAPRIGAALDTKALAFSITRSKIGNYIPLWWGLGYWIRTYNG